MENIWRRNLSQIEIKSLNAYYDKLHVLKDINLNVEKGEIVSLIGPSGSGKSSLLKMLVGLLTPKSGEVSLNNNPLNYTNKSDLRTIREQIAIVFQQYNLFQNMNVLKNVCIAPTKIQKRNQKEVEEQAVALLEKVGLKDKLKSYPDELSGGQQQRVAIARALCLNPEILLLDEVTSALDPELVQEVLDSIRILASEGMTMLIVSHEMSFVKEVSSRVVFMDNGSIIEINEPKIIFDNPKEKRTLDFVGKILKDK
ncbi:amino acid ABC transporter ATP-binding protein [Candidatus Pelagibacter sp.]|nr:amino acid ABC transporter ATP-binding protein [Candidatus Pelagibacter sp.]